jgi:hypothetical protein
VIRSCRPYIVSLEYIPSVALALMIRDYPDVVPTPISVLPSLSATSTSFPTPSPASIKIKVIFFLFVRSFFSSWIFFFM